MTMLGNILQPLLVLFAIFHFVLFVGFYILYQWNLERLAKDYESQSYIAMRIKRQYVAWALCVFMMFLDICMSFAPRSVVETPAIIFYSITSGASIVAAYTIGMFRLPWQEFPNWLRSEIRFRTTRL